MRRFLTSRLLRLLVSLDCFFLVGEVSCSCAGAAETLPIYNTHDDWLYGTDLYYIGYRSRDRCDAEVDYYKIDPVNLKCYYFGFEFTFNSEAFECQDPSGVRIYSDVNLRGKSYKITNWGTILAVADYN